MRDLKSVAFNRDELVSVIIPAYNAQATLEDKLNSVRSQIRACFYMGLSAAGAGDGGIGAAAADGFEVFVRQFCCEAILHFDEIHFFLHLVGLGAFQYASPD